MMQSDSISCQYHGLHFLRFTGTPAERAELFAAGWRDTIKYGWVCPACQVKYPQWLKHLKDRRLKGDTKA